jgi:hypothetical protein
MGISRFRLRTLMVVVAVTAVSLAMIRGAERLNADVPYLFIAFPAYVLVPSLSLLAVTAVNVGLGLAKRGQASPFATGYLFLGGLMSFAMCLALATQMDYLYAVTDRDPDPVQGASPSDSRYGDALEIAMLALPQIASGLVGGGLAVRYGIRMVRGGRGAFPAGPTSALIESVRPGPDLRA